MWGLLLDLLARFLVVTGGVFEATDDPEDPEPLGLGPDVVPALQTVSPEEENRKNFEEKKCQVIARGHHALARQKNHPSEFHFCFQFNFSFQLFKMKLRRGFFLFQIMSHGCRR